MAIFQKIDQVVLIDTHTYYHAPLATKYSVARTIGKINLWAKKNKQTIMLIGPGRWGTSSPELGIPISFAEISNIKILCEVPYGGLGIMPELSYGSHFFQDLVETNIFYAALIKNDIDDCYQPELLTIGPNIYKKIVENNEELEAVVKVYDMSQVNLSLISDAVTHQTVCMFL